MSPSNNEKSLFVPNSGFFKIEQTLFIKTSNELKH